MPAKYGIRYTCNVCGTEADVWREDGNMPSIHCNHPPGWRFPTFWKNYIGPTRLRPIVCPDCVPCLEVSDAIQMAHRRVRDEAVKPAGEALRIAFADFEAKHPRPPFPEWIDPPKKEA